jgi:hypothetical protein
LHHQFACILMSKIKNNVISHPLPPPSLRLQSPMLQLPPFSPANLSIGLKKSRSIWKVKR